MYYILAMTAPSVLKTIRIPRDLDERIMRVARARKQDFSTVLREAAARGLADEEGIDMADALIDFIGKSSGIAESPKETMKRYGRSRHR